MPFSNELGMYVYDPREGEESGARAGQAFAQSFQGSQNRALDARKLKMVEDEQTRKARVLQLQQMGLQEMKENMDKGMPFREAYFKSAPKFFADDPAKMGDFILQDAKENAAEIYRNKVLQATENWRRLQGEWKKAELDAPKGAAAEAFSLAKMEQAATGTGEGAGTVLAPGQQGIQMAPRPQAAPEENFPGMPEPQQAPPTLGVPQMGYRGSPEGAVASSGAPSMAFRGTAESAPNVLGAPSMAFRDGTTPQPGVAAPNLAKRAMDIYREQQAAKEQTTNQKDQADLVNITEEINKYQDLLKRYPNEPGLKELSDKAQLKLTAWRATHPQMEGRIQIGENGKVDVMFGPGVNTSTTVGDATTQRGIITNIKNSVLQIDQTLADMGEKDVGIPGYLIDNVLNKYVAQIWPEAGDQTVAANRAKLANSVETYLQKYTGGGRLSAPERAELRSALVTRQPGESLPRAKSVLRTMAKMNRFEAISRTKSLGAPLEPWMFQNMNQTEIMSLSDDKILSEDEAARWAATEAKSFGPTKKK